MSIRLRLAVVFAAASAVLFTLGGWLFVSRLSASLQGTIDSRLAVELTRAPRYVSSLQGTIDSRLAVELTRAPRYVPSSSSPATGTRSASPGEYVVQVVDGSGRLRGGSADAGTHPLLPAGDLRRARDGRVLVTVPVEGELERVLAAPLPGRPGWVAVAGVSLETKAATLRRVTQQLVVAGLVLVLVAGFGAYGLARAALSPVERLRREVSELSEREDAPGVRVPRTRDEIAALAATMNALLDRLRGALAGQRALVADASHELRTPFAVLMAELELAGRPGRSREELAEAVERAGEETARLFRLTEQLLFLARSDEDRVPPRRVPTDLALLLTRRADHAAARARAAGVVCEVDVPEGLTATLDPDRIGEAIDNLVDNALRFAPAGTAIVVSARADGSRLVIEVADRGPGFPTAFLPHAFERFARPDSSRAREAGGAGLGLAIVEAVAAAHGGTATVRNRPDGGAVVTLELPDCGPAPAGHEPDPGPGV